MEYKIVNLSPIHIAKYLESAFKSRPYIELIEQSQSIGSASNHFQNIGKFLSAYLTSTGDMSVESMYKIIYDYSKNYEKLIEVPNYTLRGKPIDYLEPKQIYFRDYLLPMIVDVYKTRIDIKEPLQLQDIINIQNYMFVHSKNNKFLTHSFSEALYESINQYGLDSQMEFFDKEYQSLVKLTGGDTPFKRGMVCLCDLSGATFGYALTTPERLSMILISSKIRRKDNETNQEFYTRCLNFKLENNQELTIEEKNQIYEDGKKMIDFYYSPKKYCIAFQKEAMPLRDEDTTKYLKNSIYGIGSIMFSTFSKDPELKQDYNDLLENLDKEEQDRVLLVETFVNKIYTKYPDSKNKINDYLNSRFIENMTVYCLNNFSHPGYADGYPYSRVDRSTFEIATFPNVLDMYALSIQNQDIDKAPQK